MTRRWSDENGTDAGFRNWGRLMLGLIPAALGGAAVLWITAAFGWIDLTREMRLRRRAMESVGVSVPPTAPIRLVTTDDHCLRIDASHIDGQVVVFYAVNSCDHWLSLPNWSFRVKAHDNTVIESKRYAFDGDMAFGPKERREQRVHTETNERAEEIVLSVIDGY